jgi:hypothetical protein
MGDKVAILGTVPNSRVAAPYDDPAWDVWCCSAGNSQSSAPPRITEWFELHSIVDLHAPENKSWYPPYIEWLKVQKFPVWMQEPNEDIPHAKVFPRRELMKRWGPNETKTNWFTSSPAWMFAYAIHRGYKTIGVFGVDMAAAEEHYTGQKAGLLRWFEIGRELGIKVIVPLESTLAFHYPLYGYAEASRQGRALLVRENELRERIRQLEGQSNQCQMNLFHMRGALEQVIFDRRTYVSGVYDAEIDQEPLALTAEPETYDLTMAKGRESNYAQNYQSVKLDAVPFVELKGGGNMPLPSPGDFPGNPHAELLGKPNGPIQEESK